MKKIALRLLLFMLCFSIRGIVSGQEIAVTQVTEDVIVLHPSDVRNLEVVREVGASVTAVRTDSGIVVIDAFGSLEAANMGRELIESRFPDVPIIYVVNTHDHADHFRGNQVFRDAFILGHVNVEATIVSDYRRLIDKYGDFEVRLAGLTDRLKEMNDETSGESGKVREDLRFWEGAKTFLEEYTPTPPSVQISSDVVLKVGGETFEVLFFGTAHTDNDLVVLCKKNRVLVMGDLLCYRKCYIMNPDADAVNWIALLNTLIDRRDEYDYVIPGHGGVVEDVDALMEQRNYLKILIETVRQARKRGLSRTGKGRYPTGAVSGIHDGRPHRAGYRSLVGAI